MALFLGLDDEALQVFLDEMSEHVEALEADLLALEKEGPDEERVARVFRSAHTIKGAAAAVGLEQIAEITHVMEEIFEHIRAGRLTPSSADVTVLLESVDYLRQALEAFQANTQPADPPPGLLSALAQIGFLEGDPAPLEIGVRISSQSPMPAVRALQALLAVKELGEIVALEPDEGRIRAGEGTERLRIIMKPAADTEAIRAALQRISEIEEVDIKKPGTKNGSAGQRATSGSDNGKKNGKANDRPGARQARPDADRTIRVDVSILDELMNLVGELVIDRGRLGGIGQALAERADVQELADDLAEVTAHLARVTGALHEQVLKARMLPVRHVFRKYPRMVRDLAQQMKKEVDFRIVGEDTELDRSLLEVLSDSLMHLLRNCLDHGLETPKERRASGKPEVGTLLLSAAYEESQVVICVQDDGRGIDVQRVREAAVRKGMISEDRARELEEHEALQLLFAPGFSTSEEVTDVSGRGVGLDVVRRGIERVGGRIEVTSQLGVGTTFCLLLPLTLATIQALLVQVDADTYAIPLSAVSEVLHVSGADIHLVGGRQMIKVRGSVVPLIWLRQFIEPGFRPSGKGHDLIAVLANHKGAQVGLVVDHLVGEQEVVVKGLGDYLGQVKGISGVTILGDGSLALIVDMGGLIDLLVAESAFRGTVKTAGKSG
ncbi:MAG: chemotaxis protein CheA [Firmicutes bacterium]|nr:chemotaxis protein CheA [Bacillota bacterium]